MRNPLQSQAAQEVISQGYAPRAVREALDILVCDYGMTSVNIYFLSRYVILLCVNQ